MPLLENRKSLVLFLIFTVLSFSAQIFANQQAIDLASLPGNKTLGLIEQLPDGGKKLSSQGWWGIAGIFAERLPEDSLSYDLVLRGSRLKGSDGVGIVFPVGNDKVAAVFGGWSGRIDGLKFVDGLGPDDSRNPTAKSSKLVNGSPFEIKIEVRPKNLKVYWNGTLHFELNHLAHKLTADSNANSYEGLGLYILKGTLTLNSWTLSAPGRTP